MSAVLRDRVLGTMALLTRQWAQSPMFPRVLIAVPELGEKSRREVCHVHESDLSERVTLCLAVARVILAEGKEGRHGLSWTRTIHLR